jgi:hypothetical protein
MKKHQYFKPAYLINLALFAVLLLLQNFQFFSEKTHSSKTMIGFFTINFLIITLVLLFTKCCNAICNAYESQTMLPKKSLLLGKVVVTLYSMLTMLFFIGSIALLNMFLKDNAVSGLSAITIIVDIVAISITLVSTYLCLSYWMIQRRMKIMKAETLKETTSSS